MQGNNDICGIWGFLEALKRKQNLPGGGFPLPGLRGSCAALPPGVPGMGKAAGERRCVGGDAPAGQFHVFVHGGMQALLFLLRSILP